MDQLSQQSNKATHKLTQEQADEIRVRVNTGEIARTIAADYGISKATVYAIRNGRIWSGMQTLNGRIVEDPSLESRFWGLVDKRSPNECWEWQGKLKNGVQCYLSYRSQEYRAQRISYQITYGQLNQHICVNIKCGNMRCVNPVHLYSGEKVWLDKDRLDTARRSREYYRLNTESAKLASRIPTLRHQIRAALYLGGKCQDCGEENIFKLQFHHRDPTSKKFTLKIALAAPKKNPWDTVIIPELDKCDLICANCHIARHATAVPLEKVKEIYAEFGVEYRG